MADLVLVHGITESSGSWDPLVAPLEAQHRVVRIDLRGHGDATREPPFDLATMAADLAAGIASAGVELDQAVLIGHSLGGMVVTALASSARCSAVINVDQPLRLGDFQSGLQQLEPLLRGDDASFRSAISMVFDAMRGPLSEAEARRIESLRRPEQTVVLGVWDPVLTSPAEALDALVDGVVRNVTVPYLALHGIDPGAGYIEWLRKAMPTATVEVWADHGHYPHLVDPNRFVDRVNAFAASI